MNPAASLQQVVELLDSSQIGVDFAESRRWLDGEIIRKHSHPAVYQIDLFRGNGSAEISGRQAIFHRWGLTFIPPGTPHGFVAVRNFGNIGIKATVACPALAKIPAFAMSFEASGSRLEQIHRDLQSILQEMGLGGITSRLLIQTRCACLLIEVLRLWAENEKEIPSRGIVEDACRYIALHYSDNITIDQLAHHCGIRPESLCRAFRRIVGVTPRRYITNLRLTQARALLDAGVSVTESARQTGFASIHYFCRAFRKTVGISPRQWLAQSRRAANPVESR
jgi:AraC-like DNA-binding protein